MHLTNASINKCVPDAADDAGTAPTISAGDCKQLMSSVWSILKERGVNITRLWERICRILTATVVVLVTKVPNVREVASGFELFGFDVRHFFVLFVSACLDDFYLQLGTIGLRLPPLAYGSELFACTQHGWACRYSSQSPVTKGHFSSGDFTHAYFQHCCSKGGIIW